MLSSDVPNEGEPSRGRRVRRALRRHAAAIAVVIVVAVLATGGFRLWRNLSDPTPGSTSQTAPKPGQHTGEVARHGGDFSAVTPTGELVVCDEEADSNVVKVSAEYFDGHRRRRITILDKTGADGRCASVPVDGPVVGHQVCERDDVAWHCGNQQTG